MKKNDYDDPTERPVIITARGHTTSFGVTHKDGTTTIAGYMSTKEMMEHLARLKGEHIAVWNVEVYYD